MKPISKVNVHTEKLVIDREHMPGNTLLPKVGPEDAGKLLMVSPDGAWSAELFSVEQFLSVQEVYAYETCQRNKH